MATKTTMTMITIGVMCTRKSLNVRPARLAMMMFGGSPTKVEAPPMLEANTSAIRNGSWVDRQPVADQQRDRRDQQDRGDVVQQRRGDRGDQDQQDHDPQRGALARLAAQIAMYSKTPVCRSTLTMIIIPSSRKITSQSIPVSWE